MHISAVLSFRSHSLPINIQILPFYTTNSNKSKRTTTKPPNPLLIYYIFVNNKSLVTGNRNNIEIFLYSWRALLPPYQEDSWCIQLFCRNRHGPKSGGWCALFGQLGRHLTQCGPGLFPYQVASWSVQRFDHNRQWPKIGRWLCSFGATGSPSNAMWPGPRPTSVPSGILIHPAVWPQQTWAEYWGQGCAPFGGSCVPI